jgi:hypothetical protein
MEADDLRACDSISNIWEPLPGDGISTVVSRATASLSAWRLDSRAFARCVRARI